MSAFDKTNIGNRDIPKYFERRNGLAVSQLSSPLDEAGGKLESKYGRE